MTPEVSVQLTVGQMVGLAKEDAHPREAANDLPQLYGEDRIVH